MIEIKPDEIKELNVALTLIKGRLQGYVLDEETGAKIANAEILVDGEFHCYSEWHGIYRTNWIQFGAHVITAKASNYQTATFEIILDSGLMEQDLILTPLEEALTAWTEGVKVVEIKVEPSTAYVGETVDILVYIDYPSPLKLPANIRGEVLVDGQSITGEWTIDYRNPTLLFQYLTTVPGNFTARAQDKSAHFVVEQAIPGTYYSPWGGSRMPICTDVMIPDVEPFTSSGFSWPGGDLKFSDLVKNRLVLPLGIYTFDQFVSIFRIMGVFGPVVGLDKVVAKLPNAYPIEWDPTDATVLKWVAHSPHTSSLLVMATEYSCPEYWNDKDELARMIIGYVDSVYLSGIIPDVWKIEYGTTCPNCNGTGQVELFLGIKMKCTVCKGLGKILKVDLSRGWRDWVKEIVWGSVCGGGYCIFRIYCPYCGEKIKGPAYDIGLPWDKLSFVRSFLVHIETAHPNHPLTAPAWF